MTSESYQLASLILSGLQLLAIPIALTKWAFRVELRLSRLEGRWNVKTQPGGLS